MINLSELYADYKKFGKHYRMNPVTISRTNTMGDAGSVDIDFVVDIYDMDEAMRCMSVTYNYHTTSFKSYVKAASHEVYTFYSDFMLRKYGGFAEPLPIEDDDIIIPLLNKFADYLQISHMIQVKDKTQFSSETHEDIHEDVQRSSLDERINLNLCEVIKDKIEEKEKEKQKLEYTISKLYETLDIIKDLDL